jgi:hypothetical protein
MRSTLDKPSFFLMNATADDWESLEQIMPQVKEFAGVTDSLLVSRLIVELIADGLLEEMKHTPVTPQMIVERPIEFWFTMTPAGRALWDSEARKYEHDAA